MTNEFNIFCTENKMEEIFDHAIYYPATKDTRPYIYCKGTISAPDALKIADFLLKQEVAYMIKGSQNGNNIS